MVKLGVEVCSDVFQGVDYGRLEGLADGWKSGSRHETS